MNLQDLELLLDYHYWARDRVIEAVERLTPEQYDRDLGNSFRSMRETVVHLFGADWIWCSRWQGTSPTALPDPRNLFPDVPSIRVAWQEHEREVRAVLARLGEHGLTLPLEYRTTDGKTQAQPFWQMLQHLVNHGSYHRGQVTTMLRQLGAAPPKAMDLIAFYRERAAAAA
jgi:uncharacterized damage-inducible protein DinB